MPTPEAKGFKDRNTGTVYALNDETARAGIADSLHLSEQELTSEQKAQVFQNIGLVIDTDLDTAGAAADSKAVGDALALKVSTDDIDDTLATSGKPADAKAAGDAIAAVNGTVKTGSALGPWTLNAISPSVGTDQTSAKRLTLDWFVTEESGVLGFTAATGYNVRVYRYKVADNEYGGCASASGWTKNSANVDPKTSWTFAYTISDVKYYYRLVIVRTDDANMSASEGANVTFTMIDWKPADDEWLKEQSRLLGLHELPANRRVLNIVKRARQLTDIKWTPAVDLPRLMRVEREYPYPSTAVDEFYEGTFKAGTEYTGIPYGRADDMSAYGLSYGFVGSYISPETFVTAAQDANSFLCKESEFDLSDNKTTTYAAVCSALVTYALGTSYVATANIPSITGMSLIGKLNDSGTHLDASNFKIGDVLVTSNHSAVITDIIKGANGTVVAVEVSEATVSGLADKAYDEGQVGGLCRRVGWSLDQMYTKWGDYNLYRYSTPGELNYTPSPYVNVGGEFDMYRVGHFPVMPYEGNNFKYKASSIPNSKIKLLINSADYGYLKVFKGDTEITGSPFTVAEGADSAEITEISAGDYSAYLCNISDDAVTNLSYTCHWKISS